MTTAEASKSRQARPATAFVESSPPHPKHWTKGEYYALVDRGIFQNQRLYLFRGELIEMAPMGTSHARAVVRISNWAFSVRQKNLEIRVQMPFVAPGDSMPEPDLLICTAEQHQQVPHPSQGLLVIEVSDSSIAHDRDKALEYAAAGVPEYWIVDLAERCVEIYRNPVPDHTAPLGFRYPPPTVAKEDQHLSPLALADANVKVADLLP